MDKNVIVAILFLFFKAVHLDSPHPLIDDSDSALSDKSLLCPSISTSPSDGPDCSLSTIQNAVGVPLAEAGDLPFMASLQDYQYDEPIHFCGGIIVEENWVLTTAFCINNYDKTEIKVIAGEHDMTLPGKWKQITEVEKIILHENFSLVSAYRNNDIALIKVNPAFNLTERVQAANITKHSKQNWTGEICRTFGWGMSHQFSFMSPVLKVANMTVIGREECQLVYSWFQFLRDCICAKTDKIEGPCMGDWGGPLVCGQNEVIGMASWSNGCGDTDYPAVFVDIGKFRHWIQRTIKLHERN